MTKRQDYISWEDYFMGVALLSSMRSKDPNTQVGACIVNFDKRIVGVGYNGFPTGCSDCNLPWDRVGSTPSETKYMYVIHAEQNAILNSINNLLGCSLYVTLFPCNECAKLIIQSGIKRVVYLEEKPGLEYKESLIASKRMLDMAGVVYTKFSSNNSILKLNFIK